MLYDVENLTRLLEYGRMEPAKMYEAMAAVLGLEFYAEADGPVYTICSNTFVLDITPASCTLLLVDDARSGECALVQAYFNAYLLERPVFFFLLRFFAACVSFEGARPSGSLGRDAAPVESPEADLEVHKNICDCVFTGRFCLREKLRHIPAGYNVFTHRFELTLLTPLLSIPLGSAHEQRPVPPNLHLYFAPCAFTIRTPDAMPRGPAYYYEGGGVRVEGRNVYVGGERCQIASFVFGKGCTLRDALDASARLRDL